MQVCGIISEYNPFHFGHAALIQQARKAGATHVAAIMTGNYVQRGEPALLSKWARTKQALSCGVDLVVELPLPWAVAGAEKFALGGVALANALGVDWLGFGSECGDVQALTKAANALLDPGLQAEIRRELQEGITYARARMNAVESLFGTKTACLLNEPNNILGIEYIKALNQLNAKAIPFTIRRVGAAHDEQNSDSPIASASKIRNTVLSKGNYCELLPPSSAEILKEEIEAGRAPVSLLCMERAILAKLRTMEKSEYASLPDLSEGLENRLFQAVKNASTLEEVFLLTKSKRYTHARIRRIVLSAFLGVTSGMNQGTPPYLRVLGMNNRGTEILRRAKNVKKLPIISHSSDILLLDNRAKNVIELENRATDLYALCMPESAPCGLDRTTGIIIASPSF